MKVIWQVNCDRYGDESKAKGERLFSIIETAELLIEEYKKQPQKPEIVIVAMGLGMALSDYLRAKRIPHVLIRGIIKRIGSSDVIKYIKIEEERYEKSKQRRILLKHLRSSKTKINL